MPPNASTATASLRCHPLEPLTSDEIALSRDILVEEKLLHVAAYVSTLTLAEPHKADMLSWPEVTVVRQAEAVIGDRSTGRAVIAVVDLDARAVVSVTDLDGRQPSLSADDYYHAIVTTKADQRWQAAMRRRGIDDFSLVQIDPWPTGSFVPRGMEEKRIVRCVSFLRRSAFDNGYARPIQGVIAFVDLGIRAVVAIEDHGIVAMPLDDGEYDHPGGASFREGLKSISITQPDGPSFVVDGHHVRWQNWDLRVSMHPIEGLVLHQIGYEDAGNVRSILHRASLAEMVVPYGDPSPSFSWRNAFDVGEVGLGKSVNSLELGCDCIGEIRYFDTFEADPQGNPMHRRNVICMHEEDFGILWKHTDVHTDTTHSRRSRRLVISSFHTLGNYDYGIFWYFYQDGTIQLEMKLTGIVATKAIGPGMPSKHEVEVAPGLSAPYHQHLFCFRLDFDVDGVDNSVHEIDLVRSATDSEANVHGNAFEIIRTPIVSEAASGRLADASRARTWHILNESQRNHLDQPVGYRLEPHASATLLAQPDSPIAQRAPFATKHLWVTRCDPTQVRPAGTFPNQSTGEDGIDRWIRADRPLLANDIVVWHTFGPTHVPRTEDWPVMPVEYAGFSLRPVGFFDRNPALDVPPSPASHCSGPIDDHPHGQ